MSSWYIFNAIGFYPMNPASAEYMVGSPIFDRVEITLPQNGHVITIEAEGARHKPFVKSLLVDGAAAEIPVLRHDDIMKAQTVTFEMSDEPQSWGINAL